MRKIVKADFRRIMKKRSIWIFMIMSWILVSTLILREYAFGKWNGFSFMTNASYTGSTTLLLGVTILLSVYGDEFGSMAMTTIIGRGFSRTKVILAKFLDTAALVLEAFTLLTLVLLILSLFLKPHMSPFEFKALACSYIVDIYTMIGHIIFASFFLFLTESIPLSVFIYVALDSIIPTVLIFARQSFSFVSRYNLDRYSYSALGRMAYADFMLGMDRSAVCMLLFGLVFFVGGFLALTILVFNKKELNF